LPIFVHARGVFLFGDSNIRKISDIAKNFTGFHPSFFY